MQLAGMLDWPPVVILGCTEDFGGGLDFGKVGAHGFDDGQNLIWVDAPHAQIAEFVARAQGVVANGVEILEFGRHVM